MPLAQIEFFLIILVRISAFVYTAPFFALNHVPIRVKAGLSAVVSVLVLSIVPYEPLSYVGVIGFAGIILKEAIAGAAMGFFANVAQFILAFVGQRMDIEIGFSMVSEYNTVSNSEVTITATFYSYAVTLMMLITNLHLYIIQAIVESFQIIPVGKVVINPSAYELMLSFITDYFILGFRIILPMFAAVLLVDTILAILAKVAPQMNMFAVGIQLKLFVGLFMIFLMVRLIPGVADLIFTEMFDLLRSSVSYFQGS